MAKFSTHLSLGQQAFAVKGSLDHYVAEVRVGQIRVTETHPQATRWSDDPLFKEEYMCFETGVGSGLIWTYGKNIFSTREEAERGVVIHNQIAYFERMKRDKRVEEDRRDREERERAQLAELQAKYGAAQSAA